MELSRHSAWTLPNIIKYAVLLFIICLIAYWPLSFGLFSLKNDAIIYFLPIRYTISECISNGYWPFWSPYLNLGYPLHIDMQSGVWNPFVQLISVITGPYTLKTLSYETILYVYISGLGMLFLLKHFKLSPSICLLFSTAYMLCGFNSDSAQFLYWISGSAFLPFCFLYYYRMITEKRWEMSVLFSFFLFLLFTTAYPAQFIILSYFLLAYTIYYLYNARELLTKKVCIRYTGLILLSILIFSVLSSPAILSYYSFLKYMDRGAGVSYELAMSNPLHPLLLFSYLLPLPAWRAPGVSITDPLGRNCFIGLLPFIFLLLSFFSKSNNQLFKFLKYSFFITLLLSFGKVGILRSITYYIFPLMDTFRHPSIFKLFTNFSGCLLAAFYLQDQKIDDYLKYRRLTFTVIAGIVLVILGLALATSKYTLHNFISSDSTFFQSLKSHFDELSFLDLTILNILIQLPFFGLIYYAFIKKFRLKWLVWGSIINCLIHAALFQPFTVVRTQSMRETQAIINGVEREGFPAPNLSTSILYNSQDNQQTILKEGPLNTYRKEIAHTFNFTAPATLETHNNFWNHEKFRKLIFSYPLLYRADTIISAFDSNYLYAKKVIQLKHPIRNRFDSSVFYQAAIKKFTPNSWTIIINSEKPGFYCLQQNTLPNWKLFIDGKEQKIITANYTYIGFQLDKGQHQVDLKYEAPQLKVALWLSWITVLSIILFFVLAKVRRKLF